MRNLKAGRFVDTPHGVGVFMQLTDEGKAVVHIINKDGETVSEEVYAQKDIKVTDKPLPVRKAVKKSDD